MTNKTIIKSCDVLVVGGGLAGCFAAVGARTHGLDVILVDKNYTGKTGCSVPAGGILVFNPEWGDKIDEWVDQFSRVGEYVVDRNWVETLLRDSYSRHRDMVSWGIPFYMKDGSVSLPKDGEEPNRPFWLKSKYRRTCRLAEFGSKHYKMMKARKKLIDTGCEVLDRIMVTDLMTKDGQNVGAVGFNVKDGTFYVFKAKATVMASGGMGFKGAGHGNQHCTGDGFAMGYRAGAELMNMEWMSTIYVVKECDSVVIDGPTQILGYATSIEEDDVKNALGKPFLGDKGNPGVVTNILWAQEVHAGRGPIYHEPYGLIDREKIKEALEKYESKAEVDCVTMLDRAGLDIFKERLEQYMANTGVLRGGGLRTNEKCETSLPGLFAAGDAAGSGSCGANYPSGGTGMMIAAVTGHRAGQSAAGFASKKGGIEVGKSDISGYKEITYASLNRKSGFTTDHVLSRIQQTILPYEVRMVMHEKRLQSALTMIDFFRDHFLPKLKAFDLHDLRNAHEVRSILLGAESIIRASLVRKESRGVFYREDFPERDESWLKWILLRNEKGKMRLWTEPVPEESWGDISMPRDERYLLKYRR
jgi:succinate dehydrogenase/fumarate reductase flavoprotein subunit